MSIGFIADNFNILLAVEIRESPADIFKKNTNHIKINYGLCNNSFILKLLLVVFSSYHSGFLIRKCAISIGKKYINDNFIKQLGKLPFVNNVVIIGLAIAEAKPKAHTAIPVASPFWSLNHNINVLIGVIYPIPSPIPIRQP